MKVAIIAGGTGAGKLASGFQQELGPGLLTVIANVADDCEFWGLHISPDLDSILFRLAGIFNQDSGFGVAGDTFATHAMMTRLGEVDWFWLGDRDLAFHIARTAMLRAGRRLTESSLELGRRLNLTTRVLPVTDDPVRTRFSTDQGCFDFQEYFVRERCGPTVQGIHFEGIEAAAPTPEVAAALAEADLVVIGPSNPLISTAPVLQLVAPLLRREATVAVSPIVGGRSLKGPTVEMMRSMGRDPSALGVAREYRDLAGGYVLDEVDSTQHAAVEELGYRVLEADTVMNDAADCRRLAAEILGWAAAA